MTPQRKAAYELAKELDLLEQHLAQLTQEAPVETQLLVRQAHRSVLKAKSLVTEVLSQDSGFREKAR